MPAAVVLIVAATMISTFLAPFVLARLYPGDTDFSRVSDIGQAYGAASAVISTLALGGVLVGLVVQYRQYTGDRQRRVEEATAELVRLAMEEPFYQQCWGARVAPEGMDERPFLYCNRLMTAWKQAWAIDVLSEAQAREYLASFFDSEVPRAFWRMHGDWQMRVKLTNRRAHFLMIVNEEYRRAEKAGPPSRPYEPPPSGTGVAHQEQISRIPRP
ncbi:DUF6082 family protein [Actinoplanes awajinensis]|uniref:Uncharacterized protein n=1 Tax=Actinoplanes awajinensis subsp. mycoplanecinus TaxID=135947 RepID=A0A117MPN2_9ACTN|nr:DUF6082 family protein [Actinoplanes awajinensis]KUL28897.1 hypothetical protein ADL15_30065 [Actinoplanes awajinensis subsp. mycoplanecinus]